MEIRRISVNPVHPLIHQSEVVAAGPYVFTSAALADDGRDGIPPEARTHSAYPYFGYEIKAQARYVFRKLSRALEAAGTSLAGVVKGHVFLAELADLTPFDEVWREVFARPITKTTVGARDLPVRGARVSVDLIAVAPEAGLAIKGANAGPSPPFTSKVEAIRAGDLVFTAGQLAHDGRTGVPPEARRDARNPAAGSDLARQAGYALGNLRRAIEAAGREGAGIAKGQVYLADAAVGAEFSAIWEAAFDTPPALSVAAAGLLVPGCLMEIDLTGFIPRPRLAAGPVGGGRGPARLFGVGDLLFASGRMAVDATGAVPPEAALHPAFPVYGSAIKLQTRYLLDRLAEDLAAAGSGLDRVVKATAFFADLRHFPGFDEVWRERFPEPPALTAVAVLGLCAPGALVAVDAVATVR